MSDSRIDFSKGVPFADGSTGKPCILRFARIQPLQGFQKSEQQPLGLVQNFIAECGVRASRYVVGLVDKGENEVQLDLSSRRPAKGDTLAILVTIPPPRDLFQKLNLSLRELIWRESLVSVSFDGSELPVYPSAENTSVWRALVPTTPLDVPGPRSLVVDVKDGRHKVFRGIVDVSDKDYPIESIWLSDAKSMLRGTQKELAATDALRLSRTSEQHWSGPFILPTEGDVTTGFGVQRFYNGVFAEGYYHKGVDYGAEEGTPVKAPANGRVVLIGKEADGFQLHGNCIGIDHGQGVTSILMHLSAISAVEGTMVECGEVVGAVGESGLATGPHLHWGLHVHGKAVDPSQWMKKQSWL